MFLTDMESCTSEPGSDPTPVMTSAIPANDITSSVSQNDDIIKKVSQNSNSSCSVPPNYCISQPLPQNSQNVNGIYQNNRANDSQFKTENVTEMTRSEVLPIIPAPVMDSLSEKRNTNRDVYDTDNLDLESDNGDNLVINTDCNTDKHTETGKDDDISRRSLRHKIKRRNVQEKSRKKRQTLQDMTRLLKQWLYHHKDNPYPTKTEKMKLAMDSDLTLTQVSNWFANARRRLKNTVKDPGMPWGTRIKVYNDHVTGNAELLSVSSEDSAWESDTERHNQDEKVNSDQTAEETNNKNRNIHTQTTRTTTPVTGSPAEGSPPVQLVQAVTQTVPVTQNTISLNQAPTVTQTLPMTQNILPLVQTVPSVANYNKTWMDNLYLSQDKLVLANVRQSEPNPATVEAKYVQNKTSNELNQQMEPLRDGAVSPPKYKQTILQRYLHDSCTHSFQIPMSPPSVSGRHRHPSGSVGSHDYEDISILSRDSPVTLADKSEEEDLYWLEISAAMALTTLARSRVNLKEQV